MEIFFIIILTIFMVSLASYNFIVAAKDFKDGRYFFAGFSLAIGLWVMFYPIYNAIILGNL